MGRMHAVILEHGPAWDDARGLREQDGWEEHAAFMDQLVDDGVILLGGPLSDEVRTAQAVRAGSEDEVRATFARDPWSGSHLVIDSIEAWTIRLAPEGLL